MYEQYRPSGFNVLPPVIKNLLILNVIFYLATLVFAFRFNTDLTEILGLHYFFADDFKIWQLITYMFMHDPVNFGHIFFNMFALWMFGNILENYWGGKKFLIYYLICGIGASFIHYTVFYFEIRPVMNAVSNYLEEPTLIGFDSFFSQLLMENINPRTMSEELKVLIEQYNATSDFNVSEKLGLSIELMNQFRRDFLNQPVVIGASGSVFGILLAFGMMFPNTMVYIYFLFPIKAKWLVIIYGIIEFYMGLRGGDNVAHYAHLGGMIFGFILIKWWERNRIRYY